MPELTINNFKGVNLDEHTALNGFSRYTYGLDIFGLAKSSSKLSFPGVLQGLFQVSAASQAASPSAVTELVTDFATYSGQNFAIGAANPGRIYRDDSPWKWVSSLTVSGAITYAGLETYGANLYYAQQAYLGKYDNTNSYANFQTFSDTTVGPRPMKVFAGSLFGGNGRYVYKYDGTNFSGTALTLPSNYVVRSLEVWRDRLYISADNTQFSTLFIWDGVSNTYESNFDLLEEVNAPKLQVAGGILWLIPPRGISTPGTPVYIFSGEFQKVITLPLGVGINTGTAEYAGGLAIASTDDASAGFEDGIAGMWILNRHTSEYPYSAVLGYVLRDQPTNKTLGAIAQLSNKFVIAAQDVTNNSYEIFEIQGSGANSSSPWVSEPIDAGSNHTKQWHGIKVNFDTVAAPATVVVKYRLDDATSWTTLKTYSSTAGTQFIPIGRTSRVITIRLDLNTTAGQETTRVHSFTLSYTPNND